jgi:photoactive yellow protein
MRHLLRRLADTRPLLVVPSTLDELPELGGVFALLAGGRIREEGASAAALAPPLTAWGRGLLDGDAVTEREPPPAPLLAGPAPGIQWVLPGLLAGMSRPGLVRDLAEDLAALRRMGLSTVVTLEEQAHNAQALRDAGFFQIHFPIEDMRAPRREEALRLAERICQLLEQGIGVVVHCKGGQGRTGTILGLCLMLRGHSYHQAVELLRQLQPRYIETEEQLAFLERIELERRPGQLRATTAFGLQDGDLSREKIDAHPFGVIGLDRAGRVISYNRYEELLARRSRDEVLGKNFFREVAPCTQVKRFHGRFLDGVARRSLDTSFRFIFPFKDSVRTVFIAMFYRHDDDTVWVLVRG